MQNTTPGIRGETSPSPLQLALVGVPSSAGARRPGQEKAPNALRAAGLVERLQEAGLDVTDFGDLPPVRFRPDSAHPRYQNLGLVVDVARRVADAVDRAIASQRLPVILGGDCSLSVGVVAGLLRHRSRAGLMYFDSDLDFNTPDTTPSGVFDGMGLAHVVGRGAGQLAGIGPCRPLLREEDVAVFGYDLSGGGIDPWELEELERSRMLKYPMDSIREGTVAAAEAAMSRLAERSDSVVVHFDVDVMDFPAVDVPHPNGLSPQSAFAALKVFAAAPSCSAIAITELNPELDPDGSHTECLVDGLVEAIGARAKLSV